MQQVTSMDNSPFAQLLNEYMEILGVKDEEIAKAIGVDRTTIFRWRKGQIKRPDSEAVSECAKFLHLTAHTVCSKAETQSRLLELTQEKLSLVPETVLQLKSEIQRLQVNVLRSEPQKVQEKAEQLVLKSEVLAEDLRLKPKDLSVEAQILLLKAEVLQLKAEELRSKNKTEERQLIKTKALCFKAEALRLKPIEPNKLLSYAGCPHEPLELPIQKAPVNAPDQVDPPLPPIVPALTINYPAQFFGREAILKRIFNAISSAHQVIIGKELSGKTSLLNYVRFIHKHNETTLRQGQRFNWLKQKYQWVFVDFENIEVHRPQGFLRYVLRELKLSYDHITNVFDLTEIFNNSLHTPTVILMDNIERGLEAPELDDRFWRYIRYLGSNINKLKFCATSSQPLVEWDKWTEQPGKPSPISNIFEEIELEPLTVGEARELLSYVSISQADAQWILETSQGWPILLQILCKVRLDSGEGQDWQKVGLEKLERYQYLLDKE